MKELANQIVAWIKNYAETNGIKTLVMGVSGGVDSALVSTLCAKTGLKLIVANMPCKSKHSNNEMSDKQIQWLIHRFNNVENTIINLDAAFDGFKREVPSQYHSDLSFANTKSRLRMVALYQIAGTVKGLVVGTGNKVEDFGVGFFTKYGDGGVDISPIADLTKTEVRAMARELGVDESIITQSPTDGLWDDSRTDESQLGATYAELEWAMDYLAKGPAEQVALGMPTPRQQEVLVTYNRWHKAGAHKLNPIPTFKRA